MRALIVVGVIGLALHTIELSAAEGPIWHKDLATVQRFAREHDRPIFAVLACGH